MKRALAMIGIAVLLAAAPAWAQEEPVAEGPELRIDSIDHTAFPEVVLTVTVPVEMNGLNLTPSNFFVSEAEQPVDLEVVQLPAEELRVALAIDTSGSMSPVMAAAKSAVTGFVAAMPPDVELALIGFGDTSELLVPFTTDRDSIQASIDGLSADAGQTAMYDALLQAAGSFEGTGERRTIVLLSDGADRGSTATLDEALVGLISSGARLLIVELSTSQTDRPTLNRLATTTDGTVVAASDASALEGIYNEVASDLINQYELTFESAAGGPTGVVVAVRTTDITAQGGATAFYPAAPEVVDTSVTTTAAPTTTASPAVTRPVAAPPVPMVIDVPWYASTTGLLLGAVAVFIAATLVLLLFMPTRRGAVVSLGTLTGLGDRLPRASRLSELTNKATLFAEDALTRGRDEGVLRRKLDQAGLHLRDGEFFLIVFAGFVVAVVGGFLYLGLLAAGVLGGLVLLIAYVVLSWLGDRRASKFRMQIPDTLQLISGSLRAGFGLNQAITAVANEQDSPSREEFARAQLEVHVGREVEDTLRSMAVRTQSEDLPWVAEAIEIHREIGGDIAELLDQVAGTVRERERVRGQIQVLSAEGKISGLVLVVLPFAIAGITFYVAPEYLAELTRSTPGQIMLALGSIAMVIGIFWIRRIVRLEF